MARRKQARPETVPAAAAGWSGPLRVGVVVGALFGAATGLIEAGLVAAASRRTESFAELFGYAALIDAVAVGLLGGLASLLTVGLASALQRRLDSAWQVAILTPAGYLLVGVVAYERWQELFNPVGFLPGSLVVQAQATIFGLTAGLALLTGVLLAPRGGSRARALLFAQRLAPAAVVVLVALSSLGVVRDLGTRGLGPSATSAWAKPNGNPNRSALPSMTRAPRDTPEASAGDRAGATGAQTAPAPSGRPNVLLVTIDSLRADHLGSYGYPKARTPNMDRLAAEGVRFARAYAPRNATTPTHASIFTGSSPSRHGVRTHMVDLLKPEVPTIAESFTAEGYITAGIFSWLAFEPAYSGLERGFHAYIDLTVNLPDYLANQRSATLAATYKRLKTHLALPGAIDRRLAASAEVEETLDGKADVTTAGVIQWLEEYRAGAGSGGRPFFLWVHYMDPHYPFTPPAPFDQIEPDECATCLDGGMPTIRKLQQGEEVSPMQANRIVQYYDGEVAFTDQEIGRLLRAIQGMGLDQSTLIVITADHGDSLGEQGAWLHGHDLSLDQIHVPLIFNFPGELSAGHVVDAVASSIDIMPTILELVGLSVPPTVEGTSLLALARDQAAGDDRYAVAELADRSIVTIVTHDWQLLKNSANGSVRLYRLEDDATGQQNLADAEPEVAAELGERLGRWQAAHP
jgi:arylsulfatase A-like enzyme